MDTVDSASLSHEIEVSNVSHQQFALTNNSGLSQAPFYESHSFLESQVPCTSIDDGQTRSCLLVDRSYKINNATVQCLYPNADFSTNEGAQLQENHLRDSDEHILLQSSNEFLMLSVIKLDGEYYRKLAKLMNLVCDDLATVMKTNIPDYSDKTNEIKQILESTTEMYNNQSEESIEKANKIVQLQYKQLLDMLEKLSLIITQPLCILMNINIDEILKDMQFQECVGPYSPFKIVKAVKVISRPTVSSHSRCSIM